MSGPPPLRAKENPKLGFAKMVVPSMVLYSLTDGRNNDVNIPGVLPGAVDTSPQKPSRKGLWNSEVGPVSRKLYVTLLDLQLRGWNDEVDAALEKGTFPLLAKSMNIFYNQIVEIIGAWGGDLLSFDGTRFLVLFDARVANDEDDDQSDDKSDNNKDDSLLEAKLAVQCALDILDKIERSPERKKWQLSSWAMVASGPLSFVNVGSTKAGWGYVVSGEVMDELARVESELNVAPPQEEDVVVLSPTIVQILGSDVPVKSWNSHKIVGKSAPFHAKAQPWSRKLDMDVETKQRILSYLPDQIVPLFGRLEVDAGALPASAPVAYTCLLRLRRVAKAGAQGFSEDELQALYHATRTACDKGGAMFLRFDVSSSNQLDLLFVSLPSESHKNAFEDNPHLLLKFVMQDLRDAASAAFSAATRGASGLSVTVSEADAGVRMFGAVGYGPVFRMVFMSENQKGIVLDSGRASLVGLGAAFDDAARVLDELQRRADPRNPQPIVVAVTGTAYARITSTDGQGPFEFIHDGGKPEMYHVSKASVRSSAELGAGTWDTNRVDSPLGHSHSSVRSRNLEASSPAAPAGAGATALPLGTSAASVPAAGAAGSAGAGAGGVASSSSTAGNGADETQKTATTARLSTSVSVIEPLNVPQGQAKARFHVGKISFTATQRTAQYVVTPDADNIGDDFLYWLVDFWDLEMPKMVISISGGATEFHRAPYFPNGTDKGGKAMLKTAGTAWDIWNKDGDKNAAPGLLELSKMRLYESKLAQLFSRGICKAAVKARAWIISGGTDSGVMQLTGRGIRDNEYRVPAIGIASFLMVHDCERLRSPEPADPINEMEVIERHVTIEPFAQERMEELCRINQRSFLEPNHSHFVLVDTGKREFGGEIRFRFQIESDLVAMVPGVLVLANGGPTSINSVIESVRQARPIIVVQGTGRFSDELASAWRVSDEKRRKNLEAMTELAQKRRAELLERQRNKEAALKARQQLKAELEMTEKERLRTLKKRQHEERREQLRKYKQAAAGGGAGVEEHDRRRKVDEREQVIRTRDKEEIDRETRTAQITKQALLSDFDEADIQEDPYIEDAEIGELPEDDAVNLDPSAETYVVPEFISNENYLLAEIVSDGDIHIFDLNSDDEPLGAMEDKIIKSLFKQPRPEDRNTKLDRDALNYAWRDYARYDSNARNAKTLSKYLTLSLTLLNIVATFVAILQQQLRLSSKITADDSWDRALRYVIIIVPLITAIVLSLNNKLNPSARWLALRASAERVKGEIYKYRVRHEPYDGNESQARGESRMISLSRMLDEMQSHLQRTDVNQTSLSYPADYKFAVSVGERDRFSMLMPEDYYKHRVLKELAYYRHKAPELHRKLREYQILVLVISGSSALLGTLKIELWVAFTTAIVAACTTLLEYSQVSTKLIKVNHAATELSNIRMWWKALTPVEKASPMNMKTLVETTESILANEIATWVQNQKAATQSEEEKRKSAEDAPPEIKRIKNPAAYMKERVAAIYNLRNGKRRFPIKRSAEPATAAAASSKS